MSGYHEPLDATIEEFVADGFTHIDRAALTLFYLSNL